MVHPGKSWRSSSRPALQRDRRSPGSRARRRARRSARRSAASRPPHPPRPPPVLERGDSRRSARRIAARSGAVTKNVIAWGMPAERTGRARFVGLACFMGVMRPMGVMAGTAVHACRRTARRSGDGARPRRGRGREARATASWRARRRPSGAARAPGIVLREAGRRGMHGRTRRATARRPRKRAHRAAARRRAAAGDGTRASPRGGRRGTRAPSPPAPRCDG